MSDVDPRVLEEAERHRVAATRRDDARRAVADGVAMTPADRLRSLMAATADVPVVAMMAAARWREIEAARSAEERTRVAIEDAWFLALNGAGLREVAQRLGRTPNALERLLERHDEHSLAQRLRSQDPMPLRLVKGDVA